MSVRSSSTAEALIFMLTLALLAGCDAPTARSDAAAPTRRPAPEAEPEAGDGAAAPAAVVDWCKGHGLPESKCTKCNPELTQGFEDAGDWCEEHGFPESACPSCNPQTPPAAGRRFAAQTIRFKGADHEALVGVRTAVAQRAELGATLEVTGRIAYDQDRVADVRSLVPGLVREVHAELGSRVSPDDVLFVLESADVGREQGDARGARQRVSTARAHRDRQAKLHGSGVVSARQLELAEQELAQAQAELAGIRKGLDAAGASGSGGIELRAPIAGVVVERPGVLGTLATGETSLATLADTSVMWALLDVPEDDVTAIALEQPVSVRVDGVAGARLPGVVSWIAPQVDTRTRTVAVRVRLENPRGELRANQFVRARIEVGAPEDAVVVPADAVQRIGEETVLFVRTEAGVYEPRSVRVGRSVEGGVAVSGEVAAGDAVVTTGAFILKTELSPESIGAGCCEAH